MESNSIRARSILSEEWLQNIAMQTCQLPALSPQVSKTTLHLVELELKKLIQQAVKFHKRSKRSGPLSVDCINLALSTHKKEQLYGLYGSGIFSKTDILNGLTSGLNSNKIEEDASSKYIKLLDIVQNPPPSPLNPAVNLHWLVIDGLQPRIPENPGVDNNQADDFEPQFMASDVQLLSKELKDFYGRITKILVFASIPEQDKNKSQQSPIVSALSALRSEPALQDLVPYFCRFIYQQVRGAQSTITILTTLMNALESMICNQNITLQYHLIQVLPVVFSCVVANKLGSRVPSFSDSNSHWQLRKYASKLITLISLKYKDIFPDLHARVLKTFLDALANDKSYATVFGGLEGLGSMLDYFSIYYKNAIPLIIGVQRRINAELNCEEKESSKKNPEVINSIFMCSGSIKVIVGKYINHIMNGFVNFNNTFLHSRKRKNPNSSNESDIEKFRGNYSLSISNDPILELVEEHGYSLTPFNCRNIKINNEMMLIL